MFITAPWSSFTGETMFCAGETTSVSLAIPVFGPANQLSK